MRLVRPEYTDPRSGPVPAAAAEFPAAKEAAFVAYMTDADVSCTQEPDCIVATGNDGCVAFICPEASCEALEGMPYYFATVEQWIVHWKTFHVAVAPVITCLVTGCPAILGRIQLIPFLGTFRTGIQTCVMAANGHV